MSQSERESIQRQLNEVRANLQLIEERKAKYAFGVVRQQAAREAR